MKIGSFFVALLICLGTLCGCSFHVTIDIETDKIVEAVLENDLEALENELKKGQDPNGYYKLRTDENSVSIVQPLEEACYLKNFDAVKLMSNYGADLNLRFLSDFNPLSMACLPVNIRPLYSDPKIVNQQTELIQFLLEQGANANYAISGSIAHSEKITPLLLLLTELDQEEKVTANATLLLQHGAQITPYSCLYLSARANYFRLFDQFTELGADVNALSFSESKSILSTLIEYASSHVERQSLYLKGADYLIQHGADFQYKDPSSQKTAYDLASESGFSELVELMDLLMSESN
jgi:lipoprotein